MRIPCCIIGLILSLCMASLRAQQLYEKLTLDVLVGGEDCNYGWQSGEVTDALLSSTRLSASAKIRLNYYFHKNWGFHGDFAIVTDGTTGNKSDRIPSSIINLYNQDYYIINPRLAVDRTHMYLRMSVGAQYRLELGKWSFIPRLSVGFAHVLADNCNFIIKAKGTNEQHRVSYYVKDNRDAEYGLVGKAYLNPSLQVSYKLKQVHLIAELGYLQYLTHLTYYADKTELYDDGVKLREQYQSRHRAGKYELRVGVTVPVSWKFR